MDTVPAGVALRASLVSLATRSAPIDASDKALLRQRVFAAVDELKAVGWPVERLIVRLKEVALEVGFRPSRNASSMGPQVNDREAVVAEVVQWCIDRYYAAGSPPTDA